ncbi:plastocyanin/azurin family copper-binding protein [Aequorivita sediminis]|uniref:plastocyanin/azurin family copper-binding protein n=1 Tax=Aequorivita sediminis TaxID=3073653 RepID=UPI0028A5BEE3|nr:plastocyanin/azurin family copper-binding protein [Aequorivita sp. F6058]
MKILKIFALKKVVLVVGTAMIFLVFSSLDSSETFSDTPTKHVVSIYQMKFIPKNIQVKKGDIIEWVNKDIVPHNITESDKNWASKTLKKGDSFSKKITANFDYFCSIHIVMQGSVSINE